MNVNKYNNCKESRENVLVLLTKGIKGYEIAKELGVGASTISRD
jgi:DNA-binding NarL/FixJ family response regulator